METKLYISKDDERKALAKIQKIVEGLGGLDSYVGMAFEGVWELAERNIRDDAGYSCKEYIDYCDKKDDEISDNNKIISRLEHEITETNDRLYSAYEEIKESKKTIADLRNELADVMNEKEAIAKDNDKLRSEIITLKAKLYDLIA